MPHRHNLNSRGFTLIELAIAMFIIALLLGSILVPIATQIEQRQISETQKTMDEIREALVGHALANGYLPCPDAMAAAGTTPAAEINNGAEDVNTVGDCQTQTGSIAMGNLPWATLGLASKDAWGNRFRYIVVSSFARRAPVFSTVTPNPSPPLQVCENALCTPTSSILSSVAVAIVISHGNNGLGAMNASTNTQNLPLPVGDELKNTNATLEKVSRTKSNVAPNEFDDMVASLSRYTLINRMISAGKLP
jgi:prepilin-type N-terminal cleavage/methylation domain-containing protein